MHQHRIFQVDRDSPPRTVDLLRLEKVLEEAPPGLQIPEAVKAKKTAARYTGPPVYYYIVSGRWYNRRHALVMPTSVQSAFTGLYQGHAELVPGALF